MRQAKEDTVVAVEMDAAEWHAPVMTQFAADDAEGITAPGTDLNVMS